MSKLRQAITSLCLILGRSKMASKAWDDPKISCFTSKAMSLYISVELDLSTLTLFKCI